MTTPPPPTLSSRNYKTRKVHIYISTSFLYRSSINITKTSQETTKYVFKVSAEEIIVHYVTIVCARRQCRYAGQDNLLPPPHPNSFQMHASFSLSMSCCYIKKTNTLMAAGFRPLKSSRGHSETSILETYLLTQPSIYNGFSLSASKLYFLGQLRKLLLLIHHQPNFIYSKI